MGKSKTISYRLMLVTVLQVCFYNFTIASDKTIPLVPEVAQATTMTTGQTLRKAMPTFMLAYQVGGLGLQAVKYAFPTEEDTAQALCTTDRLESVQMFEKFKTCLLSNPKRSSVIGELGIPTACEVAARQLSKKGAAQEVDQMIHIYTSDTIKFILKK
ncbi:hypothetical protein KBD08_00325 [Candidatus Babeliales bacterium]|nr:hypothetical protein [Candidatus Babeliales bacterium]